MTPKKRLELLIVVMSQKEMNKLFSSDPHEKWTAEQEVICEHEKKIEEENSRQLNNELLIFDEMMECKDQEQNSINSPSAAEKIQPDEVNDGDFIGMVKDDIIYIKGLLLKARERMKAVEEQQNKIRTTMSNEELMELVEAYQILEQKDPFDEWYEWDTSKEQVEKDYNNQDSR